MIFSQNKSIILASGSPRRKELLERYGLRFRIIKHPVVESFQADEKPLSFVNRIAKEKAEAVAGYCCKNEVIIAADTIVIHKGTILGKPKSATEVYPMLLQLNGQLHQVITAYVIYNGESQQFLAKHAISKVYFNKLTASMLKAYAKTIEPLDKAGAYSIQGVGTFLVGSIEGSYNNIVGLPIEMLLLDLLAQNVIYLHK